MLLTWILIPVAVVVTSLISGVFGMAGGMILMGFYAAALPVATAMILHGYSQLAANGFRWYMLRQHTFWPGLRRYALGALVSTAVFSMLSLVPDKTTLFLFLGLVPLVGAILPRASMLDFSRPSGAFLCGALVTGVQLLAGVAGSILDLFFVKSGLSKEEVVATKAVTQSLSHFIKLVYFARLAGLSAEGLELPLWLFAVVPVLAWVGTRLGNLLLERLSDRQFRRVTQALTIGIGVVYLGRGLSGLLEAGL